MISVWICMCGTYIKWVSVYLWVGVHAHLYSETFSKTFAFCFFITACPE